MLRSFLIALLLFPTLAAAENRALVLTLAGEDDSLGFLHGEITASYAEGGFTVTEGLDLTRADLRAAVAAFEAEADTSDHLVIHLTGGLRVAGGLTVFVPADLSDEGLTSLMTEGLPLPLFAGIAARKPGQSMLVLDAPYSGPVPEGVLVIEGDAQAVADLVALQMLTDGLAPSQIDPGASGVRLSGLVSDGFRLGHGETVGVAVATPESTETALALSFDDRLDLQTGLAELGFDPQSLDGAFGGATRKALRGWQSENGFDETGYLTAETLGALMADITAARTRAAALLSERAAWDAARTTDTLEGFDAYLQAYPDGRFTDRARDRLVTLEKTAETAERVAGYRNLEQNLGLTLESVATLENRLTALGFTPGPADGRVDIETRRSIAQFQAQAGLTPTGYLNPSTIQRLIVAK